MRLTLWDRSCYEYVFGLDLDMKPLWSRFCYCFWFYVCLEYSYSELLLGAKKKTKMLEIKLLKLPFLLHLWSFLHVICHCFYQVLVYFRLLSDMARLEAKVERLETQLQAKERELGSVTRTVRDIYPRLEYGQHVMMDHDILFLVRKQKIQRL